MIPSNYNSHNNNNNQAQQPSQPQPPPLIGVLALQGAFQEHQLCLEAVGCRTKQVRTAQDLQDLDGIVLPGGESTAMGLIGTATTATTSPTSNPTRTLWHALQEFCGSSSSSSPSSSSINPKPVWGTCAGMILLADQCIGGSAVITQGQALIGGMDVVVCRNYFGSQISSFEMDTPPPPPSLSSSSTNPTAEPQPPFPGVFIRAPAILTVGSHVQVLSTVVATPCRQAAMVLQELDAKLQKGEDVIVVVNGDGACGNDDDDDDKNPTNREKKNVMSIALPGAAEGTQARKVICAARKDHVLCTAFHPELTSDRRWHEYFVSMVQEYRAQQQQ